VTLQAEYFEKIAAAGFKTVRIQVRWSAHAEQAPPYTINPKFLERVDWAVHQSLDHGLTPIVDLHHYDALYDHPEQHRERFVALWKQIAEHYADYPPSLALELLNEPRGNMTAAKWNALAAETLAFVRSSNPTREVVIGPVAWNGISELKNLELPAGDRHLVVTVHYYSPFQFTHQGADFAGPEAMQSLGRKWTGTRAEEQAVERDFDTALTWGVEHHRPMFLGEFGSYYKADLTSRARWTRFIVEQASERKMGTAYWEFCSGFGVYDPQRNQWIEPLREALVGLNRAK
jgi:endoglucanase